MSFGGDGYIRLLPAIYRVRDQLLKDPALPEKQPAALQALFKAISEQVEVLKKTWISCIVISLSKPARVGSAIHWRPERTRE